MKVNKKYLLNIFQEIDSQNLLPTIGIEESAGLIDAFGKLPNVSILNGIDECIKFINNEAAIQLPGLKTYTPEHPLEIAYFTGTIKDTFKVRVLGLIWTNGLVRALQIDEGEVMFTLAKITKIPLD